MIVVAQPVAMEVGGAFVSRSLIRMQRVLPEPVSQTTLIMEESDVVAHACEPPHVVDHPGRVDKARELTNGTRTNGANADGEAVWFWHPLLVLNSRRLVGPTGLGTSL